MLYEMLTGLPLFSGESVPHILADVLRAEPNWNRLPRNLHPRIRQLLERCLKKKIRDRYHSIADARVDVEEALRDPRGVTAPAAEAPQPITRFIVTPPLGTQLANQGWLGRRDFPRWATDRLLGHESPTRLFNGPYLVSSSWFFRSYDVGRDGRFLMIQKANEDVGGTGSSLWSPGGSSIVVVRNWAEDLKRRVPTKSR